MLTLWQPMPEVSLDKKCFISNLRNLYIYMCVSIFIYIYIYTYIYIYIYIYTSIYIFFFHSLVKKPAMENNQQTFKNPTDRSLK